MKKTILSVLLALAMVICLAAFTAPEAKAADTDPILFHCVCGNKHSTALADGEITWKEGTSACYEGCDGAILEWTAWNANSTTNGGNYYLIAIATTKRGLNKDVGLNIDMNGYKWEVANNRGCDVRACTINICNTRTTGGSIAGYGADAKSPNGIAMNQWGGNLTLYGIDVMGIAGNAAISHGGAIYHNDGSLKMVGGSITGAPVTTLGGALRIESKGNVTLQNVTVTGAAAQNGGAISTNGKLTMTGCTVTGANTSNVAAALHVGSGSATIVDTTLTGATAKGNGGTICVVDGSLTMTGGSVNKEAGILSRANELEKLGAEEKKLQDKLSLLENDLTEAQRSLDQVQFQMTAASDQLREAEDQVLRLQGQEKQHEILLGAITDAANAARAELEALQKLSLIHI